MTSYISSSLFSRFSEILYVFVISSRFFGSETLLTNVLRERGLLTLTRKLSPHLIIGILSRLSASYSIEFMSLYMCFDKKLLKIYFILQHKSSR
jgi:hypothetical protein